MYYILAKTASLFSSLKHLKLKPKRLGIFSFVLVAVFIAVFWMYLTEPAGAIGELITWTKDTVLNLIAGVLLILASFFMKLAIWMLAFIIELAGYNGFIDSSAVTVGWVMVRDIANMFFVVILLVIAFGTILGIEQYEWKKLLVKFMLAAILVNFSRVICGLIIDASQVIMLTFINGVAATAGGNLINMFNWNDIQSLSENSAGIEPGNVFMAAVGALAFSALGMAVIAVYLIILLARLVVLWVLIVLSPFAFVLSVVPQTQKYAQQWWQKFGGQVIIGPVLAFFLWLSFVTLTANTEGIHTHIAKESSVPQAAIIKAGSSAGQYDAQTAGVTKAMTWHNMANFAIAISMLIVGAKAAQETGAVGGGIMTGAIDFGKKVAMVASGVAAGMYLAKGVSGAYDLAGKGIKAAAYHAPLAGGKKIEMAAKTEWESIKGWYYGKGMMPNKQGEKIAHELALKEKELGMADGGDRDKLIEDRDVLNKELEAGGLTDQQKAKIEKEKAGLDTVIGAEDKEKRASLATEIKGLQKDLEKSSGRGVVGWFSSRGIALEKRMEKTKRQAEERKKILWKRTGSESGGFVLGMSRGGMRDAQDRMERGWLKVEEARSKAKDDEGENQGEYEALSRARYKNGKYETSQGTMQDRIVQRKIKAEEWKSRMDDPNTPVGKRFMNRLYDELLEMES